MTYGLGLLTIASLCYLPPERGALVIGKVAALLLAGLHQETTSQASEN